LQTQFVVDEVSNIIKESIESTIGGNGYAHAKVSQWTNSVVESCLASLTKLQKPFKYIGETITQSYNF
jgi:dynein light chain Tctex-type 1